MDISINLKFLINEPFPKERNLFPSIHSTNGSTRQMYTVYNMRARSSEAIKLSDPLFLTHGFSQLCHCRGSPLAGCSNLQPNLPGKITIELNINRKLYLPTLNPYDNMCSQYAQEYYFLFRTILRQLTNHDL